MSEDQALPTFMQFDTSDYYTYQCELTDQRLPAFISALIENKCIHFQLKVFRIQRILLTNPTIVVMKAIK